MKALVIQGVQPMSFFEGEGASEGFRLLDPRLQLPGHQACGRIVDRIDKRLSDRIREEVKSLRQPCPSCVIEIDCWPAPTNDNYFGACRSRAPLLALPRASPAARALRRVSPSAFRVFGPVSWPSAARLGERTWPLAQ